MITFLNTIYLGIAAVLGDIVLIRGFILSTNVLRKMVLELQMI
jgi:hypothetical protein